jgi:cupin
LFCQRCEGQTRGRPCVHGDVVRFSGGEGRTVGIGGRFTFDDETSGLLLKSLPPLIHIRGSLPHARALRSALDLITFETEAARLGCAAIGAGYAPSCL